MNAVGLLAIDLDGTALRTDNTLSPAVARALIAASESGITVAAASGRPYHSMPKQLLRLGCIDYVIASNGAAIYDRRGKRIYEDMMNEADVLRLLELTAGDDLIWEAFLNGATYTDSRYLADPLAYGCTEAYIDYVRGSRGGLTDMRKYIYDNRKTLDSVEYVCTDKAVRESVRKRLEDNLEGLYITSSSENFVEFMNKTANKSNAVKKLCATLNIKTQNTAAAGNADNDADMIAHAGLGAAVENASPLCRAAADVILPSNDDDGVAELVRMILNPVA